MGTTPGQPQLAIGISPRGVVDDGGGASRRVGPNAVAGFGYRGVGGRGGGGWVFGLFQCAHRHRARGERRAARAHRKNEEKRARPPDRPTRARGSGRDSGRRLPRRAPAEGIAGAPEAQSQKRAARTAAGGGVTPWGRSRPHKTKKRAPHQTRRGGGGPGARPAQAAATKSRAVADPAPSTESANQRPHGREQPGRDSGKQKRDEGRPARTAKTFETRVRAGRAGPARGGAQARMPGPPRAGRAGRRSGRTRGHR